MPFVELRGLLQAAHEGRYCLAAFNLDNLEVVEPLIRAAEAEQAPVIIQGGPVGLDHAGWEAVGVLVRALAARSVVPVALHLDHGATLDQVRRALEAGFNGVMLDGSSLEPAAKLDLTRQTVELARRYGASVEAELGAIAGTEEGVSVADDAVKLTEPAEAAEFVAQTGVDCLAVSIGNVHWLPSTPIELDLPRLADIRQAVSVPLVLHGGAGVADPVVEQAVQLGITKWNIAYLINRAFVDGLREALARAEIETTPGRRRVHPHKVLLAAKESVFEVARARIRLLGGRARA